MPSPRPSSGAATPATPSGDNKLSPYSVTKGKPYASHFSWYIDNASDYPASFAMTDGAKFKTIRVKEGTDYGEVYKLKPDSPPEYISLPGDSQNIYNSSDEGIAAARMETLPVSPRPALPRYPDNIELLIVGGEVAKATERVTGDLVSLEEGGAVSPLRGHLRRRGPRTGGFPEPLSFQDLPCIGLEIPGLPEHEGFRHGPSP